MLDCSLKGKTRLVGMLDWDGAMFLLTGRRMKDGASPRSCVSNIYQWGRLVGRIRCGVFLMTLRAAAMAIIISVI